MKTQYDNLFLLEEELDGNPTLKPHNAHTRNSPVTLCPNLRHSAKRFAGCNQAPNEPVRIGRIEAFGKICFKRGKALFCVFTEDHRIGRQPAFSLSRRLASTLR